MDNLSSPIFAIRRHRIEIDGPGVRTLVGFCGCPLNCQYCINPQCHNPNSGELWTPMRLNEFLKIDDLYFKATNGGVTFGGGEPGLCSEFIMEFRRVCNPSWTIAIETSLNYSENTLMLLLECVDWLIIDVKDMSNDIYNAYTNITNDLMIHNLYILSSKELQNKCAIKIPRIPNHNTQEDVEKSKKQIMNLGFNNIEIFDYIIKNATD